MQRKFACDEFHIVLTVETLLLCCVESLLMTHNASSEGWNAKLSQNTNFRNSNFPLDNLNDILYLTTLTWPFSHDDFEVDWRVTFFSSLLAVYTLHVLGML